MTLLTQLASPSQKILIIGAECTGKSTLAHALTRHYHATVVPEYMRNFVDNQPAGYLCQYDDMLPIACGQMNLENHHGKLGFDYVICDTGLPLLKVYSDWYFGKCPDAINQAIHQLHYDWVLLTDDIGIEWVADGQRDLPHGRTMIRQKIIEILDSYHISYYPISGTLTDRIGQIKQLLDNP